jgi:dTDP-4-amino-4,6-dideoxygalactose transaminase
MWPRKQLDIDWSDLAYGLSTISHATAPADAKVIGTGWFPAEEALVSLSVRSGWDLFLAAVRFPPGSEIIMSSVTIHDMAQIIEHHRLVPVPIDVDPGDLEAVLSDLEQSISPRTKAILVAHLFGSRTGMEPIIRLARRNNVLVVEDCAQAFVGREYAGHAESDCSLFSFGPIKTATALGGAVLRIRDADLRQRMDRLKGTYPFQRRGSYLARLAKYAAFRRLSTPRAYGAVVNALTAIGADYDRVLGSAAHSFGKAEFFRQIRRQPSSPLRYMLQRRIATFEDGGLQRLKCRIQRGVRFARSLSNGMVLGSQNPTHTYWVMPVRVGNPAAVLTELRRAGFDATDRSSLVVVPSQNRAGKTGPHIPHWLAETIFLPNGDAMPDQEWDRMATVLRKVAQVAEPSRPRESLAPQRVPIPI